MNWHVTVPARWIEMANRVAGYVIVALAMFLLGVWVADDPRPKSEVQRAIDAAQMRAALILSEADSGRQKEIIAAARKASATIQSALHRDSGDASQ